jgi:hypothetical protein
MPVIDPRPVYVVSVVQGTVTGRGLYTEYFSFPLPFFTFPAVIDTHLLFTDSM